MTREIAVVQTATTKLLANQRSALVRDTSRYQASVIEYGTRDGCGWNNSPAGRNELITIHRTGPTAKNTISASATIRTATVAALPAADGTRPDALASDVRPAVPGRGVPPEAGGGVCPAPRVSGARAAGRGLGMALPAAEPDDHPGGESDRGEEESRRRGDGGRVADLELTHRHLVDVGGQGLAGSGRPAAGQQPDQLEVHQRPDAAEGEQRQHRGSQVGQCDVQEFPPWTGAVDPRRLILPAVDGLHPSPEDQHREGEATPDVDEDDGRERGALLVERVRALLQDAPRLQVGAEDSVVAVEHPPPHQCAGDDRYHVRNEQELPDPAHAGPVRVDQQRCGEAEGRSQCLVMQQRAEVAETRECRAAGQQVHREQGGAEALEDGVAEDRGEQQRSGRGEREPRPLLPSGQPSGEQGGSGGHRETNRLTMTLWRDASSRY